MHTVADAEVGNGKLTVAVAAAAELVAAFGQ
jgi:hypothetical protein